MNTRIGGDTGEVLQSNSISAHIETEEGDSVSAGDPYIAKCTERLQFKTTSIKVTPYVPSFVHGRGSEKYLKKIPLQVCGCYGPMSVGVFLPVSPPLQLGPHLSTCICLPISDGAGVKGKRAMLIGLLDTSGE